MTNHSIVIVVTDGSMKKRGLAPLRSQLKILEQLVLNVSSVSKKIQTKMVTKIIRIKLFASRCLTAAWLIILSRTLTTTDVMLIFFIIMKI